MTTPPRVALLGPVRVAGPGGEPAEPRGARAKALVVVLAQAGGRPVSAEALIDELWGDDAPHGARAALHSLVSRLRAALAPGLLTSDPAGYRLGITPDDVDLIRARDAAAASSAALRRGEPDVARTLSEDAMTLWRGEPGADLPGTAAGAALAADAAVIGRELRRTRAQARLELGDADAVIADLEALAAASPLDDAIHLMLFNAYALDGRRTDAMRLFGEYRARLRDELGTRPAAGLIAAHTALLRADDDAPGTAGPLGGAAPLARADAGAGTGDHAEDHAGAAAPPPASRSGEAPALRPLAGGGERRRPAAPLRMGLRAAPNTLIGRSDDLAALDALVAGGRMTTILGPGGLGKTRMAYELGRRSVDTPAVIVVELASVRHGDDIPLAVAAALGIRELGTSARIGDAVAAARTSPGLQARVIEAIGERETLLIVDNCEHLVDAAARWIADALDWCPQLRVLATSRAPLSIAAERVYRLEPLTATASSPGAADGPAVRLFLERATAARPGAALPVDAVARLCARLDGLPLAIELAAARVRSLSVDEIGRRLDNRFALLSGGDRAAPERHRTLFAVIDWSWNLLGRAEQRVLRRVSPFPDGFSVGAARAVASDEPGTASGDAAVDEALDALVEQSLIGVQDDPETGEVRYRLLETVREFGQVALADAGEAEATRERFLAWAADFARATLPGVQGDNQLPAFHTVRVEQDTLIAALRAGLAAERRDIVAPVMATLALFWAISGAHSEVTSFGEPVVRLLRTVRPGEDPHGDAATTLTLIGIAFLFSDRRTSALAVAPLRRLHAHRPNPNMQMRALAELLFVAGNAERADRLLRAQARSPHRDVAFVGNLVFALLAENRGETAPSTVAARAAHALAERDGDVWGAATAAQLLAQLHSQDAEPREALLWARRAEAGLASLGAHDDDGQLEWLIGVSLAATGEPGDADEAEELLTRLLSSEDGVAEGDLPAFSRRAIGLAGLAELERSRGNTSAGLELYLQAAESLGSGRGRSSPWYLLLGACALAAATIDGHTDDPRLPPRAHTLRIALHARQRLDSWRVDLPALGTGLFAVGSWHVSSDRPDVVAAGLRLMILAEAMHSKQDLPALRRAPHWDRATAIIGQERVAAARQSAAALTPDAATALVAAALSDRALRGI